MDGTLKEIEVVRDPERVAVLLAPERRRLVGALLERPDSAVGLSRRLGETRQRLNYHLRVLEEAGLVEVREERQRRGAKERVLGVVARGFVVDPEALGELAPASPAGDRFSATYLVALASRAIRELADLLARARTTGKRLATAGVSVEVKLAEPSDFSEMVDDLTEAVGEVVARYHTDEEGGRGFRVVLGSYPAPPDHRDSGTEEER